jgi:ABC-type Zn2+ transport system substrate-binding protein/surface adhesin
MRRYILAPLYPTSLLLGSSASLHLMFMFIYHVVSPPSSPQSLTIADIVKQVQQLAVTDEEGEEEGEEEEEEDDDDDDDDDDGE